MRKDFTLSEAVAIKRALEPIERAAAKERQGTRTDKHPGKLPTSSKGRAADKAAKATGMARRTLEKAEAIVDAAEAEPEKIRQAARRHGSHWPGRRRLSSGLKIAKQAEQIRAEPPPLPGNGPYRVDHLDLPWPYEKRDEDPSHRRRRPYPTMSIAEMCAMPVPSIMHEDSIFWLWTTNPSHARAFDSARCVGLRAEDDPDLGKDHMGTGDWLRGQTEHAIMAVRGKPIVTLTNQTTRCTPRCGGTRRSRPSSTISSNLARPRATPICSRATGTTSSGIATWDEAPRDAKRTSRALKGAKSSLSK